MTAACDGFCFLLSLPGKAFLPIKWRMRIDVATDTYEPDVNGVALTLERLVRGLRTRGHLACAEGFREGRKPVPGETAMPSSLPCIMM